MKSSEIVNTIDTFGFIWVQNIKDYSGLDALIKQDLVCNLDNLHIPFMNGAFCYTYYDNRYHVRVVSEGNTSAIASDLMPNPFKKVSVLRVKTEKFDIKETFQVHQDEYLKFDRIIDKFSDRSEVHLFILLDKLFLGVSSLISGTDHDIIYLSPTIEELNDNLRVTPEVIIDLIRCGVNLDDEGNLFLFI